MRLFHLIISPILIIEIALAPLAVSLAHAQDTPEFSPEFQVFERFSQQLENSSPEEYPERSSADSFHLTEQAFTLPDGSEHELSRLNSNLPEITVVDFDEEVSIDVQNESLTFTLKRKGKLLGTHRIRSLKAVSIARDQELLIVLDKNGVFHAIDLVYARTAIFKGPIPVFQLKTLSPESTAREIPPHRIRLEFLTRKSIPAGDSGMDRIWTAGDVVVRNLDQSQEILETLPRDVVQTQIYTAEAILGMLAFTVAPDEQSGEISPLVLALQNNAEILAETQKKIEAAKDPWVARALGAFSSTEIQTLIARASVQRSSSQEIRDRFTLEEWKADFQKASQDAVAPAAVKTVGVKELLHSQLTPSRLKRIAAWTLGTAATCVATYCAVNALADPQGVAWATHLLNQTYNHLWPEVLKDQVYRITLLKSSLALGSALPIYWGVSSLTAKLRNKADWNFKKELGVWSLRFSAFINLPFFHRLAKLTKQPNFLKAMRMGVNPFSRVELEEGAGKTFIGLNTMIGDLEKRNQEIQKKSGALEDLKKQRSAEHRLAWTLALAAVSERSGVDPATLTLLTEKGELITDQLEEVLKDPKTVAHWTQTAEELFYQIEKMDTTERQAIVSVNPDLIRKYYQIARETADKIQTRGRTATTITRMKLKWKKLGSDTLKFFGSYGLEEYQFLKQVEPTQFIVDQTWKQFTVDYLLAIGQMGLFGERAKLDNPHDLAADPNSLLWTTPGHLTDMLDQVRIYGLNVPATFALVYMKAKAIQETSYLPVETKTLVGSPVTEGFMKGMWRWMKGAGNLEKANYGNLWMRDLIKRLKTIQGNILLLIPFRLVLGGQGIVDASAGFLLALIWANWQYGWIWSPINRGNQIYEEDQERLNKSFMDAKIQISQGLRLNDTAMLNSGYQKLKELYDGTKLPESILEEVAPGSQALQDNAKQLLEFSLENPPFAEKVNGKVGWISTLFGALSTTYLAAALSVKTFQKDEPWGPILGEATLLSAGLYISTFLGQKLLNKTAAKLRSIRESHGGLFPYLKQRLLGRQKECANLLNTRKPE